MSKIGIKIFIVGLIANTLENIALLYYNKVDVTVQQTLLSAVIFAVASIAIIKLIETKWEVKNV